MMLPLIKSDIRYIYFDFDNVLVERVENRSKLVAHLLGLADPVKLRSFYVNEFHEDAALERQYRSLRTVGAEIAFYQHLFSLFTTHEKTLINDALLHTAAEAFVRVPLRLKANVVRSLQKLQGDYELGILTNGLPSRHMEIDKSGLRQYFANVLISCDVGIEKPDPAIYQQAGKAAGEPLAHLALVDDEQANLDGAVRAGFGQAVMFTPAFWQQV